MPTVECDWDGAGDFEAWLGLSKDQWRQAKLAYRQGGQKRFMKAYHSALSSLHSLGQQADIWIASNRPWQRLDNVDGDTRWWLERQGVQFKGLLFGDDKYGDLVEIVDPNRILGVVEDLPDQFDRAKDLGLPVWQIARQHNSHPTQERRPRANINEVQMGITLDLVRWDNETGEHSGIRSE